MAKPFGFVGPRGGRPAQHLAHEDIVVGHMFQPIPVGIQAEADDAPHEDLPEIHAGATGGFLAGEELGFQQGEDLGLEGRVHPHPLEAGEERRQFVPALARQANLFDGRDLQFGLGLKVMAQGGECCRFRPLIPSIRSIFDPTFAHQ